MLSELLQASSVAGLEVLPGYDAVIFPSEVPLIISEGWLDFDKLEADMERARINFAKLHQERPSDCSEERIARTSPGFTGWADARVGNWEDLGPESTARATRRAIKQTQQAAIPNNTQEQQRLN